MSDKIQVRVRHYFIFITPMQLVLRKELHFGYILFGKYFNFLLEIPINGVILATFQSVSKKQY
jgi:hypothetical protein